MRQGVSNKKTGRRKEFNDSPRFVPFLDTYHVDDCGSSAISMLTAIPQKEIKKALGKHEYWTDIRMVAYLRSKGYTVEELTISDITNKNDRCYNITDNHVLLVGQWMLKDEGTWCLVHRGYYYHNFHDERLKPLEFFNNPIDRVYVVSHDKWRSKKFG